MVTDGLFLLGHAGLAGFFSMFWHTIIFEVPRFLLAAFAVVGAEAMRIGETKHTDNRNTKVSILLAGHNEGRSLRAAVVGLREQTHPHLQIVVVDDGSTDNMKQVGNGLRREGLIDVFLSRGLRSGKAAAANLGLLYCTGEVIIIADVDTTFDRDAIAYIVDAFADPSVGGVSGNIAVRNPNSTVLTKFQAIQYFISISLGRRISNMLGILFIASGAFAGFRREALLCVGGWEVGPGEDADITIKLRRAGWKIRFQPEAWALTDVPESFQGLFNQRLRWQRSLVRVRARKFARMFDPRHPNFCLSDALGTLDILFFQGLLPSSFYVYVLWLFARYGYFAFVVLGIVSVLHAAVALLSFSLAMALSGHNGQWRLLPYVPGYALFNAYVMRAISVISYIDELVFRGSYRDTYVPRSVQSQARNFENGII